MENVAGRKAKDDVTNVKNEAPLEECGESRPRKKGRW